MWGLFLGGSFILLAIGGLLWITEGKKRVIVGKALLLLAILSFLFLVIGGIVVFSIEDQFKIEETKTPIYALQDNIEVDGRLVGGFFVISGYIDSDLMYSYRASYKDGSKTYTVSAKKSYIVEDNTQKPVLYTIKEYQVYSGFAAWYKGEEKTLRSTEYKFVVPEGSFISEFNLDMQ